MRRSDRNPNPCKPDCPRRCAGCAIDCPDRAAWLEKHLADKTLEAKSRRETATMINYYKARKEAYRRDRHRR